MSYQCQSVQMVQVRQQKTQKYFQNSIQFKIYKNVYLFSECASSSLDSSLKLWDLHLGSLISSIEVGPIDIWTVVFSPDDKFIVSGSHAGKIHLYGTESGKQEQVLDTRGGKFTLSVACVSICSSYIVYILHK